MDIEKKTIGKCISDLLIDVFLVALSILIPLLILVYVFKSAGFDPFVKDGKTLLSYDMQSEYITYLRNFKYLLKEHGSFIYTETKVFGGDYISIYSFYLASPFNFFVVLVEDSKLPAFFLITSIIKLCLASMNMYLLLRFMYKKRKLGYLIFAVGYGLISYSVVYLSNYMWLDGVMILPLCILGLEFIKKDKKYWLYPLCVAYSLYTSWYIGFMICVFLFMFIVYMVCSMDGTKKERLAFLLRASVFSLIGGFLAAFMWFSAYLHFSGTKATSSLPAFSNFSLSMFFSGFLENNYVSNTCIQKYHGYVTMCVGMIPPVFYFRYFLNKKYSFRERMATLVFSVVLFFIVENSFLNAMMHGGREPTWFPGRYTFVIGFFLVYIGAKEYEEYLESPRYSFILPIVCGVLVLLLVTFTDNDLTDVKDGMYLRYTYSKVGLYSYGAVCLLTAIYPFFRDYKFLKEHKRGYDLIVSLVVLPLACLSSYRSTKNIIDRNIEANVYQTQSEYLEDLELVEYFDKMKNYDLNNNYRMESTFNRPGNYNLIDNNPMMYSYAGLSHFSSSEKKDVESYFQKIGFQYNYFFEKYDGGSTSAINSFLNLKYLIDDSDDYTTDKPVFMKNGDSRNTWEEIEELKNEEDSIHYYRNKKALPYGFIIDDYDYTYVSEGRRKEDGSVYWYDHLEYQNEMFKTMVADILDEEGNKKDIFHKIELNNITSADCDITVDEDGFYHVTCKSGTTLVFSFDVPEEAYGYNLYFGEKNMENKFNYYMDGRSYTLTTYWHKGIRGFSDTSNHHHTLRINAKEDLNDYVLRPEVYYEDLNILNEYLDKLLESSSNDLKSKVSFTSYSYSGTIDITDENRNKTLFFTFPNESNMSIYIDGKKQKTVTRMNIFTAIDFDNLSIGMHDIKIMYTDKGFVMGLAISSIALASLVALLVFYPRIQCYIFDKNGRAIRKLTKGLKTK